MTDLALGIDPEHVETMFDGMTDMVDGNETYATRYAQGVVWANANVNHFVTGTEGVISSIGSGIRKVWEYIKSLLKRIKDWIFGNKKSNAQKIKDGKDYLKAIDDGIRNFVSGHDKISADKTARQLLRSFETKKEEPDVAKFFKDYEEIKSKAKEGRSIGEMVYEAVRRNPHLKHPGNFQKINEVCKNDLAKLSKLLDVLADFPTDNSVIKLIYTLGEGLEKGLKAIRNGLDKEGNLLLSELPQVMTELKFALRQIEGCVKDIEKLQAESENLAESIEKSFSGFDESKLSDASKEKINQLKTLLSSETEMLNLFFSLGGLFDATVKQLRQFK